MRKVASSLDQIVGDIAQRKHAAAVARRRPDASAEKPADVAERCLSLVAANLVAEGYASRARGRRLVKRDGDFTYEIFFQLDRHNYAGGRVAVWTHAAIGSLKLRHWRTLNRMPWGGLPTPDFAGGQIGNLRSPCAWMTWDFADPAAREATIDDLIEAIRQIVFPFFAMFKDRDAAMAVFERAELLGVTGPIEYAQAHFGREGAHRLLKSFLAKEPGMIEPFLTAVDLYCREGLPLGYNGETASALAAMAVFLELEPLRS